MAINSLSDCLNPIDQPTPNTHPKPRVRDYVLESCRFLPCGNEAVCRVRDFNTGALRQVLASKLMPISWGKDAYLLELIKGGNQ